MKPSYTDFDCFKCIASTENQKQSRIQIADMISYFVLEVFFFDKTDVYSSMLNKKDKKNKFETIVYLIKCFKRYNSRPKIKKTTTEKPIEISHLWGFYALMGFILNKSS